jgi:DNA-binding NtrC family response regulator
MMSAVSAKPCPPSCCDNGFTVALAATVGEAPEQIRTQTFDLLVCDLNIEHERDGTRLFAPCAKSIRIASLLSSQDMRDMESAEEGISLGIEDCIAKPADADTLVALLAEKLAARQTKSAHFVGRQGQPTLP